MALIYNWTAQKHRLYLCLPPPRVVRALMVKVNLVIKRGEMIEMGLLKFHNKICQDEHFNFVKYSPFY